jgi:GDP-4-dehydro-6-deoxy-D-mannose reductase
MSELALKDFSERFGLKTTILRLFNHSHRSQSPNFFLPHFYQQLISHPADSRASVPVGNVDVCRDIGSIGDLLRAFEAVLNQADTLDHYEVFNVCSGQARNLRSLAVSLAQALDRDLELKFDPSRARANEPGSIRGSYSKLREHTGWIPQAQSDQDFIHEFLKDV